MSKPTRIRLGSSAVGHNLAEYLARAGYLVHADCGGRGTCGKCRVQLAGGYLYANPECTRLAVPDGDGCVLACRTWGCSGAIIVLPDQQGEGLTAFEAPAKVADASGDGFGIALDIGTTTLAAALVSLADGKVLATTAALNPQLSFGADVVSRIQAVAQRPETLAQMQRVLLSRVRDMIRELADGKPIPRMTVAGNPTMLHVLCGVSPVGMGTYPFTPAFTDARTLTGAALDLPVDTVTCLPSISAFVGGDITAGMLHVGLTDAEQPTLLIDLGTNGESVLFTGKAHDGKLFAASAAAGPALEGAGISSGMGGVDGAVRAVQLQGSVPICSTVGDLPARGICGSGLVDLAACLYTADLMDETGTLAHGDAFTYATTADGTPLTLTQADVRALQLCKSAIRASIEALCARAGIPTDTLSQVYLAGGLGYHINVCSAVRIGLLPPCFEDRTRSVGNAALGGCVRALTDKGAIGRMQAEAARTQTAELSTDAVWNEAFMAHMTFPEKCPLSTSAHGTFRTLRYRTADSTNAEARRIAAAGVKENTLIIAHGQTAGRGRLGRSFYSPDGTGLYATLLWYPDRPVAELSGLTCATALAACTAIEQLCGVSPRIKWVNDLYLDGRKVCGILCESFGTKHGTAIAIGIGINLTTKDFPAEISGVAGSLGAAIEPEALAMHIFSALPPYLQSGDNALWLQGYRDRFLLTGARVECITAEERFPATVLGIDDTGALRVIRDGGVQHTLYAGEVSLGAADPTSPFYKP